MSNITIKNAFNAGEVSPSFYGRLDVSKFGEGCSTLRNFFVDYRGGAKSRAGFAYVGTCKQQYPDSPPRDIPFQFNISQGYALEFGTDYMRVKSQGAYVTETLSSIPNPNFGAIEGFVGADTTIGHSSNSSFVEDRDVGYIVQLEPAPSTGTAGFKTMIRNTDGSQVAEATITDLGIPSIGLQPISGHCLHPNGNVYFVESDSTNSVVCDWVDARTLTLGGTFGTSGSQLGSDATHFANCFQMTPLINVGSVDQLVSVGLAFAGGDNEIAVWNVTPSSLIFNGIVNTTELNATVCEGARGTGTFYALGKINYLTGASTPFTLYECQASVSTSIAPTITPIASISPTDVDPTWTEFIEVRGLGYDNKDGNLLVFVQSAGTPSTPYYLIKVKVSDGTVLWASPVNVADTTSINLSTSYMDGTLQYLLQGAHTVKTVDLSTGFKTTTPWNAGITAPDDQAQQYDQSAGAIYLDSGYSVSTGPIPTYLGSWLANNSDTIPTHRCMAIYSTEFLPGVITTESNIQITNISNSTQAEVAIDFGTVTPYSPGDWIYIRDVQGMTNFNGLTWIIDSEPSQNVYILKDMFGNFIDSTNFPTYISGGITERIFTLVTPYAGEDLPYLKYTQSADTMTLCCVNPETGTEYPPYTLTRQGNAEWTLTQDVFQATIQPPSDVAVDPFSSAMPTTWYSYVVTSVSSTTAEESVASQQVSVYNNDISINLGSNTLSWTAVPGASSYNVYAAPASYSVTAPVSSVFGYIGTALGSSYVDSNITPDFTMVPPVHFDPFAIGAVTDVVITDGGDGNYSQGTISWSMVTSTGSDFDGFPIVANGFLVGFVITNQGHDYVEGDHLVFSDSGGGVAKGSFTATAIPTDEEFLTLAGLPYQFRVQGNLDHPEYEMLIQHTIALNTENAANFFTARTPLALTQATYQGDPTHLFIQFKTPGTIGNAFTIVSGTTGWTASGATLTGGGVPGTGAAATLTIGPLTGTYPSVPAYFQQRRVYAGSKNKPDTYYMSQPGLFSNMDTSIPVTDSDSITGTPWSQQVNGIQFMVPMPGGLVTLTGKGAWQVNGGSSAAITPSNQTATAQAYNGCNNIIPPIPINYDVIFVQAKGSIVRDLSYNFYTNIYTGTDLTVLSNHLFQYNTMNQMVWTEEPHKLVWLLRDDGILLCLTYMKEQDVFAWTRHDTNGLFVSICSVVEPPVDALYVITQRFIQGKWRYYSERLNNRSWQTVEGAYCVDAGLSYPVPNEVAGLAYVLTLPTQQYESTGNVIISPDAALDVSAASGTGVTFSLSNAVNPVFSSDNIGNIIRAGGGKAVITTFVDENNVLGDFLQPITEVLQDNTMSKPVPFASGSWSLAPTTTVVPNLNHLEGQSVSVLADGSVVPNLIVTNGQITLPEPASIVTIGLPYTCQLQTLFLDKPDQMGTSQTRRKNISAVGIRVEATRGLQLGADQPDAASQPNYATVPWEDMNEIKERNNQVDAGEAVPLYTGDHFKTISSGWNVKGQVAVQQVYPLPANIQAIVSYWMEGDDK